MAGRAPTTDRLRAERRSRLRRGKRTARVVNPIAQSVSYVQSLGTEALMRIGASPVRIGAAARLIRFRSISAMMQHALRGLRAAASGCRFRIFPGS